MIINNLNMNVDLFELGILVIMNGKNINLMVCMSKSRG